MKMIIKKTINKHYKPEIFQGALPNLSATKSLTSLNQTPNLSIIPNASGFATVHFFLFFT